jgi:hypothetical protein
MPTATLKFKLPEEDYEFSCASHGRDALGALWEIQQQIFRPARKHGYSNPKLVKLIEEAPEDQREAICEAIGVLEEMFCDILSDCNINIDKLML